MAFSRVHALVMVTPDDPAYENKPSDWNADHSLSGADVGGIPYCPTATTETTSANLTYSETSGPRLQVGGTTAAAGITITGGTITANSNPFLITTTRNAAGVTFDAAIKAVITDTASAAASLAMQILGGASGTTSLLALGKTPFLTIGAIGSGSGGTVLSSVLRAQYWNDISNSFTVIEASASTGDANFYQSASFREMTAPAGTANQARIFAQDNGAGKTQLMVIFGSGVAQQIAIEA